MFWTMMSVAFVLYIFVTAFFLILENRRPQSTYAWLLAFVLVPIVGVLFYIFTGRGWKAFSQEKKLAQNAIGADFVEKLRNRVLGAEQIATLLATHDSDDFSANLLRLVAHNTGSALTAHNDVEILQDADEFYPRLLTDLRNAQHHIHLQYYIWTDDEFTHEVKDVLIERARAGVEVRALYDASNRPMLGKGYMEELQAAGVQFLPYMAYNTLRSLHLANYRCHRKITVIDGKIGYLGGMNLDKEQIAGVAWPRWRDTQVRIYGEAALALQIVFLAAWDNTTEENVADLIPYFPDLSKEVSELLPVQITVSGPDSQWHGIRQLYFYLIVSARKHVYIQSPFFIPDETISEAMKSAALAGVDVRMICTPRGHKYQVPYRAANTYFCELAEAGVKIFLYDDGYYHAKTINMDSLVCTIGSANMDVRSFDLNYEINSVIYDDKISAELGADFLADQANSTPFDLEEYNSRSVWTRFVDSIYRLASPVM